MNAATFHATEKVVTIGNRRFRVVTCALKDIPAYLDQRQRDPHSYTYFPQVYDEVLITKARDQDEHPNPS